MTTRVRIIASAFVIPLVFLVLSLLQVDYEPFMSNKSAVIPIVLALIEIVLVAWVVDFKLKGERIYSVLAFPALSIAILVAFLDVVLQTTGSSLDRITGTILSLIVLFVVNYILVATINILNLSSIKNIPLGQAGRAAHYILTMIFSYFSFVLLVSSSLNLLFKIGILVFLIFSYTFVALWTISLAYSQRFTSTLGITILMVFIFLILNLWPIDVFNFALFLVLVYYMCLGVALEIREIISRWIWYEYLAIFLVILILLLSTASWGINGTII